MAAGEFTLFSVNKDDININDLVGATVKVALVASTYNPDASSSGHDVWADVSANQIANGNGYTTGGVTLTGKAAVAVPGGFKFDSNDPSWTASGTGIPAWRFAVMYVSGVLWGLTDPLIGYFIGDDTPQDVALTASGNALNIVVPAAGWFDVL